MTNNRLPEATQRPIVLPLLSLILLLVIAAILFQDDNFGRMTVGVPSNTQRRELRGGNRYGGSHHSNGGFHSSHTTHQSYHPSKSYSSHSYYSNHVVHHKNYDVVTSHSPQVANYHQYSSKSRGHIGKRHGLRSWLLPMLGFGALGLFVAVCWYPSLVGVCCCCCCGLVAGTAAGGSSASNAGNSWGGMNADHMITPEPFGTVQDRDDFYRCIRRTKQEVEGASAAKNPSCNWSPYSGIYLTSFVDQRTGFQHSATLNLSFTPDFGGQGHKISGKGDDIDGSTLIEDGHVNHDGTAWWLECTVKGEVGLQVLSRGKFSLSKRTFHGTWLASSMEQGHYMEFSGADEEGLPTENTPLIQSRLIPEAAVIPAHDPPPSIPSVEEARWDNNDPWTYSAIPFVQDSVPAESGSSTIPIVCATLVPDSMR